MKVYDGNNNLLYEGDSLEDAANAAIKAKPTILSDEKRKKGIYEIATDEARDVGTYYWKLKEQSSKKFNTEENQIVISIENINKIRHLKKNPDPYYYRKIKNYRGKVIYMICAQDFSQRTKHNFKKTVEETLINSSGEKKLAYCKINKSSPEWEKFQKNMDACFYIGTTKNIQERLREHFFLYNPQKSAMHLETWFEQDIFEDLLFKIHIWGSVDFPSGIELDYVQDIEDILFKHYKPMFGRLGKNMKGVTYVE